jgi:hypothetical protein
MLSLIVRSRRMARACVLRGLGCVIAGGWGWIRQRAVLLPGVGWLVASSSATNAILVRPPRFFRCHWEPRVGCYRALSVR